MYLACRCSFGTELGDTNGTTEGVFDGYRNVTGHGLRMSGQPRKQAQSDSRCTKKANGHGFLPAVLATPTVGTGQAMIR